MEEILRKLIAFPSVAGNTAASHDLLQYVADFVSQRGMHVVWFESNGIGSIVATVKPDVKTPKVMLAAHADVVPAGEAMFTLRKEQGRYLGRGVLDMKFAIAAYMQIIDEIRDDLQQYDLGLMITCDEESSGRDGTAMLVDEGYLPEVCILPDGGDNWQLQTGSKGLLIYEISVDGKSAHGARPWQGDNALTKLIGLLDEIAALFPREPRPDTNTISLTKMDGGQALNQVPGAATMTIDIRTMDSREYARLHDAILQLCARHQASCKVISDGVPTSFDLKHPLVAPYADLVTEVTGIPVTGFFAMGASDARYYVPYGTPFVMVYPKGGDMHSDDEWLDVEAFEQFKRITRRYLDKIARSRP